MSLIGCFGFYVAYREWMSWLLLMTVVFLPWLSLLLSLPAMFLLKVKISSARAVLQGEKIPLCLQHKCPLPAPPASWQFRIRAPHTGEVRRAKAGEPLHAEHCGCMNIRLIRAWKYDYLGLFRWPLGKRLEQEVLIWPKEIPVDDLPSLKRYLAARWKPKPGSFTENYDLRIYRAGDDLRQIHWKLSAKTGKLIFREPIIPIRGALALTMILSGSANVLDKKFGKLLYVSRYLLEKELPYELHCLCGDGMKVFRIANQQELHNAIAELLSASVSPERTMPQIRASWHYHIGGEQDEA